MFDNNTMMRAGGIQMNRMWNPDDQDYELVLFEDTFTFVPLLHVLETVLSKFGDIWFI